MESVQSRWDRPPDYYKQRVWLQDLKVIQSGVREVIKTVEAYLKKNPKTLNVLDVGSGEGEFAIEMAKKFKKVIGVEPFKEAYEYAKRHILRNMTNVSFVNSKIENYNTKEKFDLVLAITIFEHLADQKKAFDKIFSLLKKGGIIYITAPNKYWFWEEHYALPFLSWLPLPIANRYLKLFTGVSSYEDSSYARSYRGMRSFFDKYSCTYDFIIPFDTNSEFLGCGKKGWYSLMKNVGIFLIRKHPFFWNFSKGFIIVVKKTA